MEKSIPANPDAERAVLGAILMNRDALTVIAPWLAPSVFYLEIHAWIYQAMLACYAAHIPPDTRTVSDELRRRGQLDTIGGVAYLSELIDAVPTSAHIEYYARIVERAALLRRLIVVGGQIAALGYDEQEDLDTTVAAAQAALTAACQRPSDRQVVPLGDVCEAVFTAMAEGVAPGIPTGLLDYDALTGGLHSSTLVTLAGRPGHGKTGLALSLALNLADDGRRVLIFSLEMSREELAQRAIAMRSRVDLAAIRRHRLSTANMDAVVDNMGPLIALPIGIDDSGAATLAEIRARALRELNEHNALDLVIVDYLQLVRVPARGRTREQEVSEVSRGLKALAKEVRAPVLALCQLNRAIEHRADPDPVLADLRESGQIEQDSDLVLFVVRPEMFDPDASDLKGIARLIIAKQRQGPTGRIGFRFDAPTTRFYNLLYHDRQGR